MTLLADVESSQPQPCGSCVTVRTCGSRTRNYMYGWVSLLQTLYSNRVQSKGLSSLGLGLQKGKRERGWLSKPPTKELEVQESLIAASHLH